MGRSTVALSAFRPPEVTDSEAQEAQKLLQSLLMRVRTPECNLTEGQLLEALLTKPPPRVEDRLGDKMRSILAGLSRGVIPQEPYAGQVDALPVGHPTQSESFGSPSPRMMLQDRRAPLSSDDGPPSMKLGQPSGSPVPSRLSDGEPTSKRARTEGILTLQ
jgi:hypothetical protein